jgi:hypothetical protein
MPAAGFPGLIVDKTGALVLRVIPHEHHQYPLHTIRFHERKQIRAGISEIVEKLPSLFSPLKQ